MCVRKDTSPRGGEKGQLGGCCRSAGPFSLPSCRTYRLYLIQRDASKIVAGLADPQRRRRCFRRRLCVPARERTAPLWRVAAGLSPRPGGQICGYAPIFPRRHNVRGLGKNRSLWTLRFNGFNGVRKFRKKFPEFPTPFYRLGKTPRRDTASTFAPFEGLRHKNGAKIGQEHKAR